MAKRNYEYVKEYFQENGCELLSKSYKGCNHSLLFIAQCGHEHTTTFRRFNVGKNRYCPKCLPKYKKYPSKPDYNYVKQFFEEQGCELMDESYINNSTKMAYKCVCGNTSSISFACFKRGQRCQECKLTKISIKNRKYNIEDVKEIFSDRGMKLLENEYYNTKRKMRYICSCGSLHKANLNSVLYVGSKCPECKRRALSGENNYGWKPELTDEEREKNKSRLNDPEISKWRREVFKRDNHTCQFCKVRGNRTLNAHHLDGYHWCIEKRADIENGVTLCEECHCEFHNLYGKGHNTREQYEEWIRNKRRQGA